MAALTALKSLVDADEQDIDILVLTDSTGEDVTEWVGKFAERLGDNHPTFTVTYADYWNGGTETWDVSATTLRSGSGSNTIRFWNGGGGGYTVSDVNTSAIIEHPSDVDCILTGVGINGGSGTDWNNLLDALETAWPSTPTALCSQNPLAANAPTYEGTAEGLVASAASSYGHSFIDVHQAFVDTANVDAYLKGDGVHPNSLGSNLWAQTVYQAIFGRPSMSNVVTIDSATTFTTTTAPNLLDTETAMLVNDLGTWNSAGGNARVAESSAYSGYAVRNTADTLFRSLRTQSSSGNTDIPCDPSTSYSLYFKGYFDSNWSTTGLVRCRVIDWDGTTQTTRVTVDFSSLAPDTEHEFYATLGWITTNDASSLDIWINNNNTGNTGVSGSATFYDFRLSKSSTTEFIPPLIATSETFTKSPSGVAASFSDPTLTVGSGYAGNVSEVVYTDGADGPTLAYLSSADIVNAFGVGDISDSATWTDSVTGRTWTVVGEGASVVASNGLHGDALFAYILENESLTVTDTELVGALNELNGTTGVEYAQARATYLGVDPAG